MKLNIKRQIYLNLMTLLAMCLAPCLLALRLITPLVTWVLSEIWCALMYPHDVRMNMLEIWRENDRKKNQYGQN